MWDRILAIGVAACATLLLAYVLSGELKFQMDLGNSLVGVGTAAMAYATYRATTNAARVEAKAKLAEFRLDWSNQLRNEIADFVGLVWKTSYVKKFTANIELEDDALITYLNEDSERLKIIRALESKIRLKLQIEKHKDIIELIQAISQLVMHADPREITTKIDELHAKCEKLFEKAWLSARNPLEI